MIYLERFSVFSSAGTGSKGCEVHPRRGDEYSLGRKRRTVLCFSFGLSGKISVSSSAGTRPKGCEVHPRRRDEYSLGRKRRTVLCFSFGLSGNIFRFL